MQFFSLRCRALCLLWLPENGTGKEVREIKKKKVGIISNIYENEIICIDGGMTSRMICRDDHGRIDTTEQQRRAAWVTAPGRE